MDNVLVTGTAGFVGWKTSQYLLERGHKVFGIEVNLVAGTNGVFDVLVDGKKVFSKAEAGHFPHPDELISKLRQRS